VSITTLLLDIRLFRLRFALASRLLSAGIHGVESDWDESETSSRTDMTVEVQNRESRSRNRARESPQLRPASDLRFRFGLCLLLGMLVLAIILAVGVGAVAVPARVSISILLNHSGMVRLPRTWTASDETIILQIRLPRVLGAALVGTALSVAGALFQGLLRNPLADPYVIGASGGAGLGAIVGVLVSTGSSVMGFGAVPGLAFLGALGTVVVVYWLSRIGGRTPVVTLLLAGFAVSIMLGYAMSFLLLVNDRLQLNTPFIYAWLLGGISVVRWAQVGAIALVVVMGSAIAFVLARSLNALSLGEEYAQHLGISVEKHKGAIIAVGSLLTAAAVSGGGLIGFVGLIVPHFLRLVFGPNHTRLLPLVALGGATFLVTADLLARTVMPPTELPVGILTAFVGGPAFLLLLRRSKREYRF
jgi:iron complex transport system permease protein